MESKVKFDLNGQNQAVITARVVQTDDVRDKVAQIFKEKFGHESCLCSVYFTREGMTNELQLINSSTVAIGNITGGDRFYDIEITPLDAFKDSKRVVSRMTYNQIMSLLDGAVSELLYRKMGGNPDTGEGLRKHIRPSKDAVDALKKELSAMITDTCQQKG